MALSTLSVFAIIRLYLKHLRRDFPLAERRPLLSMLRLRKKGLYQVFGLVENGKLVGYGATAGQENEPLLLDYLAVCQGERGKGVGSRMLSLLCGQMKNMLLAEVESPLITDDPNEPQMRWRRIRFYERNGFYLNRYPYRMPCLRGNGPSLPLLLMSRPAPLTDGQARQAARRLYREVYAGKPAPELP